MKFGNIVSPTEISVSDDFNVVKSMDLTIQGLPTLIIGWDYIKKTYPDYNIITRKLDENLYWTFKKTENRGQHEEDIYNFIKNTYNSLVKELEYIYIDPILYNKKKIKKIIRKITSVSMRFTYLHENVVYIYGDGFIFGIDLSIIEFIGLDKDKIINKIKSISNTFLTKDVIFIEYKKRIEKLDNQVKYIPYLYSIKNG